MKTPQSQPDRTTQTVDVGLVVPWHRSIWTWFWVGALVSCLPMLSIYFSRMWRLPHYQYFPFAVAAVIWLAWSRSDRRFYPPSGVVSLLGIVAGAVCLWGSWSLRSPWVSALAFVCFCVALLTSMRGAGNRTLLALALPLVLLIRLPLGLDQTLVVELQHFTTGLSSLLLDVIGVPHSVHQNVITLASRELFVAEACSGIQSVFTLAFLSTLIIAVCRRRLWLTPLYLVIALILAVAGNVLRVSTVASADYWFGIDLAEAWPHDLLGYLTLGVAVLFLLSFDRLIVAILHTTTRLPGVAKDNPLVLAWNYLVDDGSISDASEEYFGVQSTVNSRAMPLYQARLQKTLARWQSTAAMAVVGVAVTLLFAVSSVRALQVDRFEFNEARGMFVDGILFEPPPGFFAGSGIAGQLKDRKTFRDGNNPVLGQNADVWQYVLADPVDGHVEGQAVVSQSYESFHELCICYGHREWRQLSRELRYPDNSLNRGELLGRRRASDAESPLAYAYFRGNGETRGYLWYAAVSASGVEQVPPESAGILTHRFGATQQSEAAADEPIIMVQIWMPTQQKLRRSTVDAITADFFAIRKQLADAVAGARKAENKLDASPDKQANRNGVDMSVGVQAFADFDPRLHRLKSELQLFARPGQLESTPFQANKLSRNHVRILLNRVGNAPRVPCNPRGPMSTRLNDLRTCESGSYFGTVPKNRTENGLDPLWRGRNVFAIESLPGFRTSSRIGPRWSQAEATL